MIRLKATNLVRVPRTGILQPHVADPKLPAGTRLLQEAIRSIDLRVVVQPQALLHLAQFAAG